jgi:regulator of sirC expression with transglutaminase-like and TPR domain
VAARFPAARFFAQSGVNAGMNDSAALDRFRASLSQDEERIDLAEAAFLIAQDDYPELDPGRYLAELDRLGGVLRKRLPSDFSPMHRLLALNRYLFIELGFAANDDNYYDPDNSLLHVVLERRRGIPITLSILYLEIGRRIGLNLAGISFPGHFLVKLPVAEGDLILDPYSGGKSLSEEDLRRRLGDLARDIDPAQLPLRQFLEPASKREILARMLRNLKAIHLKNEEHAKALRVMNRLLIVSPDQALEWRDRGLLYERMECSRAALEDLESYLKLAPLAEDAAETRAHVARLRELASRLH